jgi:hypothetical protein
VTLLSLLALLITLNLPTLLTLLIYITMYNYDATTVIHTQAEEQEKAAKERVIQAEKQVRKKADEALKVAEDARVARVLAEDDKSREAAKEVSPFTP